MSARILIIEDNAINAELMAYLLTAAGFAPITAADGEDGVRAARAHQPGLIVCDIELPLLDGFGVVRTLRADPLCAGTPILALTGSAEGDARFLEAGFDGVIRKPIAPEHFVDELRSYLPAPRPQPAPRRTILVLDDHVLNREFLRALLGYTGHRLLEAGSGTEALTLLENEHPDLVIADVLMPGMDGYEFVGRMRGLPGMAQLPVIFYTASVHEREAEELAQRCGVRCVLPKPSDPQAILRAVQDALGEGAAQRASSAAGQAIGAIDSTMAAMLDQVQSSSAALSRIAAQAPVPEPVDGLSYMTERLTDSLSSLQAVSLRLTSLIDLGIALGEERDAQALVDLGCRVAKDICAARYAVLALLTEDGAGVGHFAACGDGGYAAEVTADPRAGVLGELLAGTTPIRRAGLPGDPGALGLPASHPPVHAFLGVPVVAHQRMRGWLYLVDRADATAFSEVDERVAVTVAAQTAVAYENLKLYEQIRQHHADLTADIAARLKLDEELRRFRAAMDASGDAIFLIDRTEHRFIDVNATACALLGYTRDEFLAQELASLQTLYDRVLEGDPTGAGAEVALPRRDGAMLAAEVQRRSLRSGEDWIIVAVARDITERKEAEQRLLQLSHYDTLTGLPNRTQFYHALTRALDQAREHGWAVGVLFLDLDRFKTVNDTLGHSAGDALLQQVGQRLVDCLRVRDTVGRFGGDEFAAILMLPDGAQTAISVVDKIRDVMHKPFRIGEFEITITASIGITVSPNDATDAATLIKYADTAMYRAKEAGSDSFRFFTAEMNAQSLARLDLEGALRRAIENNEFVLYYQPKIDLASGRISGAEALIRWQRPGIGLVSPALFIPVLEDMGLIARVGAWVLDEACRKIAEWSRSGAGPVHLAVNVASGQFFDSELEREVLEAIRRHDIAPELLELELTEGSLMSNAEETVTMLRNLKALGVKIAVDDFGTGYSSLAYLRRFPIDKLKIDIAFVREVTSNPDDAAIVLAIINMAHSLKRTVVAEGVEREAQLAYLRRHGCDEIQGFYFSRPVPAEEFEAMVREGRTLATAAEEEPGAEQTLLIVDDDAFMLDVLSDFLAQDGYRIFTAQSPAEGFDILARHRVQVIVCDQCMPVMTGTEFMERVKNLCPDTFRIMLSAYADLTPIMAAVNHGAVDRFYMKPWKGEILRENIREGFRLRALH